MQLPRDFGGKKGSGLGCAGQLSGKCRLTTWLASQFQRRLRRLIVSPGVVAWTIVTLKNPVATSPL